MNPSSLPLFLTCLLALACSCAGRIGGVAAAETPWKVGIARAKITPAGPLHMAGYVSRQEPADRVTSDLFAKALALEDDTGHRALIITADLIGFRAVVADPLCEKLMRATGLTRAQILLNASHTHCGPLLKIDARYRMDETAKRNTRQYIAHLTNTIVQIAVAAFDDLQPARLSWGTGMASFTMNRRKRLANGSVTMAPNPAGTVDRQVPVLRIDGPDGNQRAVLFGYACHNTTLTGKAIQAFDGDYAGYAQTHIERHDPATVALFLEGCGADANPYPRGGLSVAQQHGAALGGEVCRILETKLIPVNGPLKTTFDRVDLPLQPPPTEDQLKAHAAERGWRAWTAQRMLEVLASKGRLPAHYTAPIAVWQFGNDLTLVGLSGEVVADYVRLIGNAVGPDRLWVSGYCNDVFGYLPSVRVLAEGGYETRGLIHGSIGFFTPKVQDVVIDAVKTLAQQAGRRLPSQ